MKYDEFVSQVRDAAGLQSREEAEQAARATLFALASRLTTGEAEDLAAQLPPELGDEVLRGAVPFETLTLEDFFRRVQQKLGVDDAAEAERRARAVMGVLAEAITQGELEDVFSQLPKEFADLLAPKSV
jgi:uncharacterized protein (DUF2267 family)